MKLKMSLLGACFLVILLLFSVSVESGDIGLIENETWQHNLTGSQFFNAIAFGDIDNDGDLDLVEIGCDEGSGAVCTTADESRIYVNNGTSFVENETWQHHTKRFQFYHLLLFLYNNLINLNFSLQKH